MEKTRKIQTTKVDLNMKIPYEAIIVCKLIKNNILKTF